MANTAKGEARKRSRKTKAWPHRVKRVRTEDLAYVSKHQDDCLLCRLDHTDEVLLDLLEARRARTQPARGRAIAEVIQKHGLDLTPEQEMEHHRRHRSPQPTPRAERVGDAAELDAVRKVIEKDPKRAEMVKYVGRAGRVSLDQIAEIWYPHIANPPKGPRYEAAKLFRDVGAPYHIFYGVNIGDNPRGYFTQIYGLGHGGAEWLSRTTDRSWDWIPGPRKVGYKTLIHDLEVNGLFNTLYLSAGSSQLQTGTVTTTVAIDNFYTARDLYLGLNGQDQWFSGKVKRTIQPDAFCAIGVELEQPPTGFPASSLNPLLLELDAGTKDERDVAAQIISHILLAQSGALKERFPDLKATPEQYAVPVMMTFEHLSGERVRAIRRMRNIFRFARELYQDLKLWLRVPFWGVYKPDFDAKKLQALTYGLWTPDDQFVADLGVPEPAQTTSAPQPGFSRLMGSNQLLHGTVGLRADHILAFDPAGGTWRGKEPVRGGSGTQSATERVIQETRLAMQAAEMAQEGGEEQ